MVSIRPLHSRPTVAHKVPRGGMENVSMNEIKYQASSREGRQKALSVMRKKKRAGIRLTNLKIQLVRLKRTDSLADHVPWPA